MQSLEDEILAFAPDSEIWASAEFFWPHVYASISDLHETLIDMYNRKLLNQKIGWYFNAEGRKINQWYYQKRNKK